MDRIEWIDGRIETVVIGGERHFGPEVTLMQFTGEYDCEGGEIFEGDSLAEPYIAGAPRSSVQYVAGAFQAYPPILEFDLSEELGIERNREYLPLRNLQIVSSSD